MKREEKMRERERSYERSGKREEKKREGRIAKESGRLPVIARVFKGAQICSLAESWGARQTTLPQDSPNLFFMAAFMRRVVFASHGRRSNPGEGGKGRISSLLKTHEDLQLPHSFLWRISAERKEGRDSSGYSSVAASPACCGLVLGEEKEEKDEE